MVQQLRIASHLRQPYNDAKQDSICSNFIQRQRLLLSQGWSADTLLDMYEVDVESVFSVVQYNVEPTALHQWIAYMLHPFELLGVPERLGLMFLASRFIQWRILRSAKAFARLPEFMKPVESQLSVPHSSWIDFILWPKLRDRLIQKRETFNALTEMLPLGFEAAISVNWNCCPAEMIEIDPKTGALKLSRQFEHHVADLDNWTLEPDFASAFQL